MKNVEIKSLSVEELRKRLEVEREMLRKLKFAHSISPIENPMKIRQTRRLVAAILTELTIKQQVKNNGQ